MDAALKVIEEVYVNYCAVWYKFDMFALLSYADIVPELFSLDLTFPLPTVTNCQTENFCWLCALFYTAECQEYVKNKAMNVFLLFRFLTFWLSVSFW